MSEPGPARPASAGHLVVEGHDETTAASVDPEPWRRVAEHTLIEEGIVTGRLDLIFVDPDAMTELNREHLGQDRPTDVLAFPLDGPSMASVGRPDGKTPAELADPPPPHLGDVVVCVDVAADQAGDHAGSVEAELTLLVVHGVLHVLGHDHGEPDETGQMQARERVHMTRHGFEHPVSV